MKSKVLIGLTTLAVLFSLTACGNKSSEDSTTFSASDVAQSEASFIADVYSQNDTSLMMMTDGQLLTIGYYACEQLKDVTLQELAQRVSLNNPGDTATRDSTYIVIASAVLHLCPEYKGQAGM